MSKGTLKLELDEVAIPNPAAGVVHVQVEAAPIRQCRLLGLPNTAEHAPPISKLHCRCFLAMAGGMDGWASGGHGGFECG